MEQGNFPKCQKCKSGDLVRLSDFGIFEAASCWVGLRQKEFAVIEKEELQIRPTRAEVRAWNTCPFLPFLVLVLALLYFGLVLMLLLLLFLGGRAYYP